MVSFGDAIKLGFNGYVKFSGRSTRAEYWWWTLFSLILIPLLTWIIDWVVFKTEYGPVRVLSGLALLLPGIAVSVRRLHDINKSGLWLLWWFLIWLVPYIIIALGLLMAFGGFLTSLETENWDQTGTWILLFVGIALLAVTSIALVIWWIIWFVKEGDLGPNQYGPDPRVDVSYSSEADIVIERTSDDFLLSCPICNVGNKPDSKFCKQCGGSLDNVTTG